MHQILPSNTFFSKKAWILVMKENFKLSEIFPILGE